MFRWDIINHLIKQNNYQSYIELGYFKGWSFDRIGNERIEKHAVDPNPCKWTTEVNWEYGSTHAISDYMEGRRHYIHKMSSDEYFEALPPDIKYDIFFIDGLHKSPQVDKDIQNALKHLNPGGIIVMHDCNPDSYEMTTTGTQKGEWTGDVYKSFISFKWKNPGGYITYVVDTDYGVGIIKPCPFVSNRIISPFDEIIEKSMYQWSVFDKNRARLLELITPEEFLQRT